MCMVLCNFSRLLVYYFYCGSGSGRPRYRSRLRPNGVGSRQKGRLCLQTLNFFNFELRTVHYELQSFWIICVLFELTLFLLQENKAFLFYFPKKSNRSRLIKGGFWQSALTNLNIGSGSFTYVPSATISIVIFINFYTVPVPLALF